MRAGGPTGVGWTLVDARIDRVAPGSAEAGRLLRAYFEEILRRYDGRRPSPDRIEEVLRDNPPEHLDAPHGALLVARLDGVAVGCAGLRLLSGYAAEVHRVYVAPTARGRGIGSRLLDSLESLARGHGVTRLCLTTRQDLVEARRLYARHGFLEVPAFTEDPYVDHWLAKSLT
ncbi:hypothetical protein Pen02_63280 [Plantactinospora endophytica]|uniref:N-acetyltransferase domain-containing protein n=1 Tax=Plantactinospora endophytica TaxID=673535 RepID=A0ABQ4E9I3_9ACTN|nr:hypothetical protein Pen02_63280 [Plantactinospora endophytica]